MKNIVLYGASDTGKIALDYYGTEKVLCFCDRDKSKQEMGYLGKPVIDIHRLLEIKKEVKIIITSHKYNEITEMLCSYGFKDIAVFKIECYNQYERYLDIKNNMLLFKEKIQTANKLSDNIDTVRKHGCIKVCFVYISFAYWNTNQSLFEELLNDERYRVQVLFINCNYYDNHLKEYWEQAEMFMDVTHYSVETEKPDLMVFNITEYWNYPKELHADFLHELGVRILLLHSNIMIFGNGEGYMEHFIKSGELWTKADLIIVHKDYYNVPNLIEMGNPKLDLVYRKLQEGLSRAENPWVDSIGDGQKVVLWNIGHGIFGCSNISELFAFDIWIEKILTALKQVNNVVLLIRPHPFVFEELVNHNIWSKMDLENFKRYIGNFSGGGYNRILLDESSDYTTAFLVSDAMISDLSGLIFTYLPTKKPILYLKPPRSEEGAYDKHMLENLYQADNLQDIENFLKMIAEGRDILREQRLQTIQEYIPNFDGENGVRVKKMIEKYFKFENGDLRYADDL